MQLIKYNNLVMNEGGKHLQRGMNFGIMGSYSVVLMSVEKNSPYADEMLENGIIKYEGHDQEKVSKELKKSLDQPIANKSGTLTQNGKFLQAVEQFKEGKREPAKIKVYRKIRAGIWVDMGFYNLIDGFKEHDGNRYVFKFLLKPNFDNFKPEESDYIDMEHNRYIPGDVMQKVFERDGGKCVMCGETDNLHYDHKIPFSKGGSSKDEKNIQILCARHNLSKGDKLVY
ncbi:MAG: Uncharacterised protein [Glaciecola sp. HTCC2999]|nr:MAG: Uncharacterised protein [Glaciecola sp. HTCC2999]